MKDNPEQEAKWIAAMVALEDERGSIVVGGAQGGVIARARRARLAGGIPPAAARARARVRHSFQAAEQDGDRAA